MACCSRPYRSRCTPIEAWRTAVDRRGGIARKREHRARLRMGGVVGMRKPLPCGAVRKQAEAWGGGPRCLEGTRLETHRYVGLDRPARGTRGRRQSRGSKGKERLPTDCGLGRLYPAAGNVPLITIKQVGAGTGTEAEFQPKCFSSRYAAMPMPIVAIRLRVASITTMAITPATSLALASVIAQAP